MTTHIGLRSSIADGLNQEPMKPNIEGLVTTQFEPVRDVFADLWHKSEIGAGLCVYYQGEKVVDLWGGWMDREKSAPWTHNTLVNIYSTTKGLASLALALRPRPDRL